MTASGADLLLGISFVADELDPHCTGFPRARSGSLLRKPPFIIIVQYIFILVYIVCADHSSTIQYIHTQNIYHKTYHQVLDRRFQEI